MHKYLAEQVFWSQKISNRVHLPVMNGWLNACDTVSLLSGSKTNILSKRSLKSAIILGSSPAEPVIIDPISLGFILRINRFIVCKRRFKSQSALRKIIINPILENSKKKKKIGNSSQKTNEYLLCDRIVFHSMKIQIVVKILIYKSPLYN